MDSLLELFQEEIQDLYSAETQLLKAMPRIAKKATSETLKAAFEAHRVQTEEQVKRLEEIAQTLGFKPKGKTCAAMKGLIEEAVEVIKEKGDKNVLDAAIIGCAQKVEHYEIASYGTVATMAKQMGQKDVLKLLTLTLNEEKDTDKKLTTISVGEVLKAAPIGDEEDEEMEDDE